MAADRGAFIDQSQSLNVHIAEPNFGKLTSMHFYGWKLGLKTGMYYLRTKAAAAAIQFTVDKTKLTTGVKNGNGISKIKKGKKNASEECSIASVDEHDVVQLQQNMAAMVCSLANKDDCLMCGS